MRSRRRRSEPAPRVNEAVLATYLRLANQLAEEGATPPSADGLLALRGVLEAHGIRGTFFVVAEIAGRVARKLKDMSAAGHEIACHGLTHVRPLDMDAHTFSDQLRQARTQLEEAVGKPVLGYRAPSFGMDDARFAAVRELGFRYDASGIRSRLNPVYGAFSLDGYQSLLSNLSVRDGFFAFRASAPVTAPIPAPTSRTSSVFPISMGRTIFSLCLVRW